MGRIATPDEESRLTKHVMPNRTSGRPTIYNWSLWTDGRTWTVTRGVDFEVTTQQFRVNVLTHAFRNKIKATTSISGDTVTFRFMT